GLDAAADVGLGRGGEREVDDDAVAPRPELVDDGEADVVEAGEATGVLAEAGAAFAVDRGLEDHGVAEDDLADEGLAHAPAGADDADGDEAFGRHGEAVRAVLQDRRPRVRRELARASRPCGSSATRGRRSSP